MRYYSKNKIKLILICLSMLLIIGCGKTTEKFKSDDILEYSKKFNINSIYFYTIDDGIKINDEKAMERIYSALRETSYIETTSNIDEDKISYRIFLCENSVTTREVIEVQGNLIKTINKTYKMEKNIDSILKETFKDISQNYDCISLGKYDDNMLNSIITEQEQNELDRLKEKEGMRDKYLDEN